MQRTPSAFSFNYNQYPAALSLPNSPGLSGITNMGHNRILFWSSPGEFGNRRCSLVLVPKLNFAWRLNRIAFRLSTRSAWGYLLKKKLKRHPAESLPLLHFNQ